MKILYLTFYYKPDLCAGSFRAESFIKSLGGKINKDDKIDIITTTPNRYDSYSKKFNNLSGIEKSGNVSINRIQLNNHGGSFFKLAKQFIKFYYKALKISKSENYDVIIATSSRFFTAYLGYKIAKKRKNPLFLDIRDIFVETIYDVTKNMKLRYPIKVFLWILVLVEKRTISYASQINLVSPGFNSYYEKILGSSRKITNFTNGIDKLFLARGTTLKVAVNKKDDKQLNILYAGNLGASQALSKIIPYLDDNFNEKINFNIIGSGSAQELLVEKIKEKKVMFVNIYEPLPREQLISKYDTADILFLHLDKKDAFKKVLPSKIFEYAVFGKPIIAGVDGYFADFLKKEIPWAFVFEPCNVAQLNKILNSFVEKGMPLIDMKKVELFVQKYKRSEIMDRYVNIICENMNVI